MSTNFERTWDEKFLNYNFITKFLHGNKYYIINNYLKTKYSNQKISVLDIGCGLAPFYEMFNKKYQINYTGIEPHTPFCKEINKRFPSAKNFKIINDKIENVINHFNSFDLILALDILEHIPLNIRFQIIEDISKIEFSDLFINVPNEIGPAILIKNIGSKMMNYNRDYEYSFIETLNAFFYKIENLPSHEKYHKGFDWRVLHYILHYYFKTKIYTNPRNLLPRMFSPNILIQCNKK